MLKDRNIHILSGCLMAIVLSCLMACSTTSNLEEGEQLYTGMKKIVYENYLPCQHYINTQEEIEAALACAPNGALFGSSYYRTIPYTLWVYNAFSGKEDGISKWMTQTIGKAPVLMSDANPELRVSVGENILQNNGYFRGTIDYKIINGKPGKTKNDSVPRPLTGKVAYTVNLGPLYTIDSIEYKGFSDKELNIINTKASVLHRDDPFSVAKLDEERTRIYDAFKNNGYYFFEKNYVTYMADTLQKAKHVQLQICKVDSLDDDVLKPWKIGKTTFRIRRQLLEQTPDTISRRHITVEYAGNKPALRPRVVLQDVHLRPRKLFSQADLNESLSRLTTKGIFASTDISFTKADSTLTNDSIGTMDMLIDCTLDKPYDFSLSANYIQKSSGRGGPGIGAGFAWRNAFRGGEIVRLNLTGNVEFQTGSNVGDRSLNYDYGADVSIEMPRLLLPNFMRKRRRWFIPPSTIFSLAYNRANRSGFFRRNVFTSEFTYVLKPTQHSTHTITPLAISHTRLAYHSDDYIRKMGESTFNQISLDEYFTPKIRYTYNYTTKAYHNNPITLSVTLAEAGNITCGLLSLFGNKEQVKQPLVYNDSVFEVSYDKYTLFHTPVSQYVRAEFDFIKTWKTSTYSKLLAHVFAGYICSYGNNDSPPFAETYYAGGANDLRGFLSRGVGPGNFYSSDSNTRYMISNGDLKLVFNLEYRARLFGSLYTALFIDAGNVWGTYWRNTEREYQEAGVDISMSPKLGNMLKQTAVDAGIGIRYDLDFFVIRLDWGFIVHAPFNTGRSGYFNFPSFKRGQCLNFAIGYPF